jgi:NADPH2:quinone reductase
MALPIGIGLEAAGVVEAVGADVTHLRAGDRVVYYTTPLGAYAEARVMPAGRVLKLPDGIDARTAVGLILCQWAKHLGATVIGTVGSDEKAELAARHGCDHPIVYTRENFVERVGAITGGAKLPVVYDSVGRETFMQSLDCLRPLGMMVLFGASSGPVPPFDPNVLQFKGSLFLTRPTGGDYTRTRAELEEAAAELFAVVLSGAVKIEVNQTYRLADAAQAHRDLEARRTTGSTVLTV